MKASLLSIGSELLRGRMPDTNSSLIAQTLSESGIEVVGIRAVADRVEDIRHAFASAMKEARLVISTGGLGPTFDDLTREGLAAAIGRELLFSPEAHEMVEKALERWGRKPREIDLRQAYVPSGCTPVFNMFGVAPAIRFEDEDHLVYCLPGVPQEMRGFLPRIVEELRSSLGVSPPLLLKLTIAGMPESLVGEKIENLGLRGVTEKIINVSHGEMTLRLLFNVGDTEALDEARERLSAAFGDNLVSTSGEPLSVAVSRQLTERGETLSTVESCTGGIISGMLTEISGSSRWFLGGFITYSNELKEMLGVSRCTLEKFGAVSLECAEEMAVAGRAAASSTYCLAVTGIAGPTGGTAQKPVGTVCVAVNGPSGTVSRLYKFAGTRSFIRGIAATNALNMLRMYIADRGTAR
ncbi:MAG: competence/damage-inducible protein A [Planctomycetota bacterium]